MSTVALDIFTGAYPSITNDIQINVYDQSDDQAILASLRHSAPHDNDTWSFAGLVRVNLLFRIFEMSGSSVVRQLGGDMNVVPGTSNGVGYKAPVQIQADVTTGFTSGVNVVTFDGTNGAPDWRGWDIDTLDRIGQDTIRRGVDFSYDPVLARLQLLNTGDVFGPSEWFNVQFQTQVNQQTVSTPAYVPAFSTPQIIRANYPINAGTDFGGLLILKPSGNYLELTFPDIATVVAGKLLTIEFAPTSVNKCAKFIFPSGQTLDWLLGSRPNLYMCPQESISIYKFIDTSGSSPVSEWRIFNPFGNFLRVGEQVVDDNSATNVFNKVLLNGADGDIMQFARFYNDFVLNLPTAEVVNYDDWSTGNNRYKYSLANSSNPANNGKFKFADRSNMYERITDGTRTPGDYQGFQMIDIRHEQTIGTLPTTLFGTGRTVRLKGDYKDAANGLCDLTGPPLDSSGNTISVGSELRVSNVAVRKYAYV